MIMLSWNLLCPPNRRRNDPFVAWYGPHTARYHWHASPDEYRSCSTTTVAAILATLGVTRKA